jgi:membrane protease YdiL (CAAX protease family)
MMRGAILWLDDEAMGKEIFLWIFAAFFFNFLYVIAMSALFLVVGINDLADFLGNLPVCCKVALCFIVWFFEEVIFRFFPIAASVLIFEKNYKVILVSVVFSALFGFLHGGWQNIFLQGVCGFVFCLLYLKCGGFSREYLRQDSLWKKFKVFAGKHSKALYATTFAHIMFNVSLVVASIIFFQH